MTRYAHLFALIVGWPAICGAGEWLPTGDPETFGFSDDRLARLTTAMQAHVDAGELPGALMVIARKGKVIYRETVGFRDVESQAPVTPDTVFRIYSMTKPITSVAAMMLVEEGKLRLTEPVYSYIPSFRTLSVYEDGPADNMRTSPIEQPITVHHLMTHTAGLTYPLFGRTPVHLLYDQHNIRIRAKPTTEAFVQEVSKIPLVRNPGEAWEYSIATDVLGYVVEKAAGMPFSDFVAERIFEPLEMTETAFYVRDDQRDRFAQVYKVTPDGLEVAAGRGSSSFFDPTRPASGGGGLVSTAADYLRFAQMLLNGGEFGGVRLLSPRTIEFMRQDHMQPGMYSLPGGGFGLGFGIDVDPALKGMLGPTGTYYWSGAARTHFWVDPQNEIIGMFFTQLEPFTTVFDEEMRNLVYQAMVD